MKATIHERGNGFPDAGEYVSDGDYLYRVLSIDSRVHTGQSGSGQANYVFASVERADWDDCPEDETHTAACQLDSEGGAQ